MCIRKSTRNISLVWTLDLCMAQIIIESYMLQIVSGAGPGVNFRNVGTSFRSTMMSSSRIPPLFENSRYAESSYIPQSGREVFPMSVRSVCDARQRIFNYSFNPHGMGNSRSVYNSRAGSPMSVRSIDTTASVSAVDIANAFEHEHFCLHDLKMIKEAYNRFVRHKVRKTIAKRRNRRVHRYRHRSGEDSGEEGSDSSVSSGDCSSRTRHNNVDMSRGVATTQSCLNRNTQKDESSLLDLIQKIVPIDKMNVTNMTNKTDQSKNLTKDNSEKWDVTKIMTETDDNHGPPVLENIFKKPSPMKSNNCRKFSEELPPNFLT